MEREERMTVDERYKYLRRMQKRYRRAKRQERGALLDEMEAVTGLHRKSLVRLMKGEIQRRKRRRERGKVYGPEVQEVVSKVARSLGYPGAERLRPRLLWTARHLARHGEVTLTSEVERLLADISVSTLHRMLQRVQRDLPRPRKPAPRARSQVVRTVPIARIPWDVKAVGHMEVDLVHHCGASVGGEYVHTLQLLDVRTGWSERVAVLGRSYLVISHAVKYVAHRLPFGLKEIHVDNGAEFLNAHFVRLSREIFPGVRLSRSRPYHKNDNRFVEGANRTLVRDYLGHDRLDTVAQVHLLNEVYDRLWLYDNFFQPVQRMVSKEVYINEAGARRVRRHFDEASPPLDRLLQAQVLSPTRAERLCRWRDTINLVRLRESIYAGIETLFALSLAAGRRQDVRESLLVPKGKDFLTRAEGPLGEVPWWEWPVSTELKGGGQ